MRTGIDPLFSASRNYFNRHERRAMRATSGAGLTPAYLSFSEARHRFRVGQSGGAPAYTAETNAAAERAVLALAQPMVQQVFQTAFVGNNAANGQILNVPLQQVGLNTKLTIEVSGTITQAAAETLTKTQWGLSNLLSNIQLTDLSNYQRVNTSGLHLTALNTLRRQVVFGAAYTNDSPVNMASNFRVCFQPTGVTTVQTFRMFWEVPIAYHEMDLRGAIYAAVTSATWRLQLTFNNTPVVGSGAADPTLACWRSSTAGDVGLVVVSDVRVYQHYLDQLPRGNDGMPVVPLMSLAWNYLIQQTTQSPLVANTDNVVPYANFRQFMSTIVIYDNAGVLNVGTDVNYVGIQAANLVFLQKLDPFMSSLQTRNLIGDDYPGGTYVFDHRRKPINTSQFGNTQFVISPSAVTAGASLMMMYEMLAIQSQAINAGSLAAS